MTGIVDAWMQHPTLRLANHEMLDSLRRWVGVEAFEDAIPLEATIREMDAGGIEFALSSAWYGPKGDLISNGEVAANSRPTPRGSAALQEPTSKDLCRPCVSCAAESQTAS